MKRIAIIGLTIGGVKLGVNLAKQLSECQVTMFIPAKIKHQLANQLEQILDKNIELKVINKSLHSELAIAFKQYQAFIMIMALGIVVRVFAPLIKDKRHDPAVVCVDEKATHVISVLSGHVGGANKLTNTIAAKINTTPVITTATDVNNCIAFDMLANKYQMTLEPFDNLKYFNGALVNYFQIYIYLDTAIPKSLLQQLQADNIAIMPITELKNIDKRLSDYNFHCIISNRTSFNLSTVHQNHLMYLRPKNLIIGIGCRKNTDSTIIINAINNALARVHCSPLSIKKITSIDIKSQEQGILKASEFYNVPVSFFAKERLKEKYDQNVDLASSEFVYEKIGVEGVCEPAALLGGKKTKIILPKTVYQQTTIAIAQESSM